MVMPQKRMVKCTRLSKQNNYIARAIKIRFYSPKNFASVFVAVFLKHAFYGCDFKLRTWVRLGLSIPICSSL